MVCYTPLLRCATRPREKTDIEYEMMSQHIQVNDEFHIGGLLVRVTAAFVDEDGIVTIFFEVDAAQHQQKFTLLLPKNFPITIIREI